MAFLVDESYLPATLTVGPMTDEQFATFCSEHSDLSFELTACGTLIVTTPNYSFAGAQNGEIIAQLGNWAKSNRLGAVADSSGIFVLPMEPGVPPTPPGRPSRES